MRVRAHPVSAKLYAQVPVVCKGVLPGSGVYHLCPAFMPLFAQRSRQTLSVNTRKPSQGPDRGKTLHAGKYSLRCDHWLSGTVYVPGGKIMFLIDQVILL